MATQKIENDEVEDICNNIRQQEFWKHYFNHKVYLTYGNARQSALAVGYSDAYSITITNCKWFKQKMRRKSLLNKAEHVLDKTLDMDVQNEQGRTDAALARVQNDTAKFIAKTLGKDEGYTERNETTGKDGSPLVFMPTELMDKFNLGKSEVDTDDLIEEN